MSLSFLYCSDSGNYHYNKRLAQLTKNDYNEYDNYNSKLLSLSIKSSPSNTYSYCYTRNNDDSDINVHYHHFFWHQRIKQSIKPKIALYVFISNKNRDQIINYLVSLTAVWSPPRIITYKQHLILAAASRMIKSIKKSTLSYIKIKIFYSNELRIWFIEFSEKLYFSFLG